MWLEHWLYIVTLVFFHIVLKIKYVIEKMKRTCKILKQWWFHSFLIFVNLIKKISFFFQIIVYYYFIEFRLDIFASSVVSCKCQRILMSCLIIVSFWLMHSLEVIQVLHEQFVQILWCMVISWVQNVISCFLDMGWIRGWVCIGTVLLGSKSITYSYFYNLFYVAFYTGHLSKLHSIQKYTT